MNKRLKNSHLILTFLIGIYLVSRLINLTALPIFNDEAMYLRWGQLIGENPRDNWLISLTDGQQPLFIWLMALAYGIGPSQFLLAGRLVSVAIGLGSLLIFFKVGQELMNRSVGLIMALLYMVVPFALWYDRLAIKDGLMLFWGSLLIFLALRQAKTGRWRYAVAAGVVLGLALLTKSIAYFFVGLYPLTVLVLTKPQNLGGRQLKRTLLRLGLALGIAGGLQSILYLSPLEANIGPKHGVFLLSVEELLAFPLPLWRNNIYSTVIWWWQYYRLPILTLGAIGFGSLLLERRFRLLVALVSWILLPISFEILRAKIYIPRYFLFTLLPVSVLMASGIDWALRKMRAAWLKGVLFGLILFPSLLLDWQILFRVEQVKLPQVERWQYLEGWPAGYGLEALVALVRQEKAGEPVLLVTEEETLVSSGLPLYLAGESGWELERRLPLDTRWGDFPQDLGLDSRRVLFIVHHAQTVPQDWPVEEIARIKRLDGQRFFLVYQVRLKEQ